ncbi:xylulokinase [Sphingobacterium sp. BIGb0165]|uniref:xylulokinase n=1 Tax=Sphingobacterium sp. BIGb0165 TaxID=2940615 RepID=UPI00216A2A4D|nr:FGGY family carbohydrate kinase [Sphingobacterium sp. BIGb0165]MCS4227255.1 xylulokinase [Sphingobacterium sp. BIGb0165]
MYFLGIDIGTSSVKVSIVEAFSQRKVCSAQYPAEEAPIISPQPNWAEQDPRDWWSYFKQALSKANASGLYDPKQITAIGIAYQMHGLVVVDRDQQVLRNAIIWCDSRAVELGNAAFEEMGRAFNLQHHLNSPGNFTASKLAWVKANEPEIYQKIDKIMLPGDFIAMKLSGTISTSISALSEGIFWDFQRNELSTALLDYYGFDANLIPTILPVFAEHGQIKQTVAEELGLSAAVTINYKAGDQPNNALSLNVLQPGEVAATAGTSGVIYGVSDKLIADRESRVNTFAHVNYREDEIRTGVLLCINGTGIMNSWGRKLLGKELSYDQINALAATSPIGSKGLQVIPFGNGAERMLNNQLVGASVTAIDLNRHETADIMRAIQEGIAFAFRYGLDIMRENGLYPQMIRAGHANLFLSPVFRDSFVGATNVPVEVYDHDGSVGAAMGAGIGSGYYTDFREAFRSLKPVYTVEPNHVDQYEESYQQWKEILVNKINAK